MGRSIGGGAEVLVTAAKRPHVGEIWAFCKADGQLVCHRHRGNTRDGRLFQGDARPEPDDPVRDDQLIGRVVAVRDRGDKADVRRLGTRERVRGWWLRTRRRWARGRDGSGVGDVVVVAADGDTVGEQSGERLPAHDAGTLVGNSGSGHGSASTDRDRAEMLTADAVLHGCTVDLLGLPVRLVASERRGAEALASVLGGARTTDVVPRIRLSATTTAPAAPSSHPDLSTREFDTWRPAPGEVVMRHRSGLTARATGTTIDVGGDPAQFDARVPPGLPERPRTPPRAARPLRAARRRDRHERMRRPDLGRNRRRQVDARLLRTSRTLGGARRRPRRAAELRLRACGRWRAATLGGSVRRARRHHLRHPGDRGRWARSPRTATRRHRVGFVPGCRIDRRAACRRSARCPRAARRPCAPARPAGFVGADREPRRSRADPPDRSRSGAQRGNHALPRTRAGNARRRHDQAARRRPRAFGLA